METGNEEGYRDVAIDMHRIIHAGRRGTIIRQCSDVCLVRQVGSAGRSLISKQASERSVAQGPSAEILPL